MFPGWQQYPEGRFRPERGVECNWHVWCHTGALQVLDEQQIERWLTEHPAESYIVNFANGSAANIAPEHPLWQRLAALAQRYDVAVYVLTLTGGYVPWTGASGDLGRFDAIRIGRRTAA